MTGADPLPIGPLRLAAARIERETGLFFPDAKQRDLETGLREMAVATGMKDTAACVAWLLDTAWTPEKTELCAAYLTVGETYFFRETRAFSIVGDYVREKLGGAEQDIVRIWSAGCCTGEEPYSIAMMLAASMPEVDWRRISILGSDLCSRNIEFAQIARYRRWSFRNEWAGFRRRHFSEEDDGRFQLNRSIRERVHFSQMNLAAPLYPSATNGTQDVDVIFCRNVLMYFSLEQAVQIIERFRRCLVDGGWLIVSPSEASSELFTGFTGVYYPDAIYFRKEESQTRSFPSTPSSDFHAAARDSDLSKRLSPESSRHRQPPQTSPTRKTAEATHAALRYPAGSVADLGSANGSTDLEQTRADEPVSVKNFHVAALTAMEAGQNDDAIRHLKRVLYLQPDHALAHYLLGVLRVQQGRSREAARQFETAGKLLAALDEHQAVPDSEGLSVAQLLQSIRSFLDKSKQ